jgi:hypothetical protein
MDDTACGFIDDTACGFMDDIACGFIECIGFGDPIILPPEGAADGSAFVV